MIAPNPLNTRYWDQLLTPGHRNQLVPGMNGPAWGLELVPVPGQPIYLRPETCCSKNHSRPLSISLKRGFFTVTPVFSLTLRHIHSSANQQRVFHWNIVFPLSNLRFLHKIHFFLTLRHIHSSTNRQRVFH